MKGRVEEERKAVERCSEIVGRSDGEEKEKKRRRKKGCRGGRGKEKNKNARGRIEKGIR